MEWNQSRERVFITEQTKCSYLIWRKNSFHPLGLVALLISWKPKVIYWKISPTFFVSRDSYICSIIFHKTHDIYRNDLAVIYFQDWLWLV